MTPIMVTPTEAQAPVSKTPRITAETPSSALPSEVITLQQMVLQLLGQIKEKTRENFDLQCQLDWLQRQLFGRRSEKMDPNQRLLFEDLFAKLQQQLEQQPVPEATETSSSSPPKVTPANRPSRRNGRVPLPEDLPRVPEYIDPDPRLIEKMRCLGEDITEILEYIPAGFYVRQIIRRKYAPRGGCGSVVMGPLPALPIEKGRPGPGVLAYIITSKYCDHLPLYRLEQIFARHGLHIPRTTQWDWVRDSADLLLPIVLAMKRLILALIAQLYIIEEKAQEEQLDAEGVKALRQKFSKPILQDQIQPLLESWSPDVLPKSPIGKAVTYALNQWEALNRSWENGILCIDNSLSERVIKLVALGRKNWLFSGSDGGAQRAAILYSLIASCKLCQIDPFLYLRDVLERINTHPANRIDELTPPRWKELFLPKISLPSFKAKTESRAE
ncbi:MAG: transposase [Phycisphaerae bacterium]|nr:transposase [Phycisphaerae bacterium]